MCIVYLPYFAVIYVCICFSHVTVGLVLMIAFELMGEYFSSASDFTHKK